MAVIDESGKKISQHIKVYPKNEVGEKRKSNGLDSYLTEGRKSVINRHSFFNKLTFVVQISSLNFIIVGLV